MGNQVWVIGHKNPDTDSVVSAIAYSRLKNELWSRSGEPLRAVPGRLGQLNAETEYVLERFGFEPPELVPDLRGRVIDVMQTEITSVSPETPLIEIGRLIKEQDLRSIPVVDAERRVVGIVTVGDVAKKYFAEEQLSLDQNPIQVDNVVLAVQGRLLTPMPQSSKLLPGRLLIGAMSPESMKEYFAKGDILLIGDRENAQEAAIEAGCACIVVTGGFPVSARILELAIAADVCVISSPLDTYTVARRITMSLPVSTTMNRKVLTFGPHDLLDEVRERMLRYKHRNYPVVDADGKLLGMIGRGNLLAGPAKKVILVDHNELSQSVPGLEDAEVCEVIDHHRLGDVQTVNPIYVRNEPVGSTATLVADSFKQEGVALTPELAGLLLSAIISDTLLFRSPTTAEKDRAMAAMLAEIAGIDDIAAYGQELFAAGTDAENLAAREIITGDLKVFSFGGGVQVAVAQVETANLDRFLQRSEELLEEMEGYRQNNRLDLFILMVTDLIRHGSELLVVGSMIHVVEKAFGYAVSGNRVFLPGVLSRKKQVIPPLGRAIQEVEL